MSEAGRTEAQAPRSLFQELRRRNVFRVAGLYLIGAWLLLQVADVFISLLALPDWSGRLMILVLGLGFVPAVVFSWVYELTPEGLRREHEVSTHESITHETGRKLNLMIGITAALALGFMVVDRLLPEAEREALPGVPLPAEDASIAVLPFADMSPEGDQVYFAEGIAEELLDLLSKIPTLRVISRTSSFQFRDENQDVRDIASKLGVAHVLEGSVRKAGDRVRITAQLIQASDGSHAWSETYDRTLDDVFAVQDDIAGAVVGELRVQLLGDELPKPATKTENSEVHNLYLRGRHLLLSTSLERQSQATAYFEQAIKLAPDYAPAWAGIAEIFSLRANFATADERDALVARARETLEHALELDPDFAEAHVILGRNLMDYDWDWAAAERAFRRALELDPGNAKCLRGMALLAGMLGRTDEAVQLEIRAVQRDPVRAASYQNLGRFEYNAGRLSQAEAALQGALALEQESRWTHAWLAIVLLDQGRAEEAVAAVEAEADEQSRLWGRALVFHGIGRTEEADAALDELIADHAGSTAYQIVEVYAKRGDLDAAFTWLDRAYADRDPGIVDMKWDALLASLRGDPRYAALLEKLNLAD